MGCFEYEGGVEGVRREALRRRAQGAGHRAQGRRKKLAVGSWQLVTEYRTPNTKNCPWKLER